MELWKIHKFCTGASLEELQKRKKQLEELIDKGTVRDTNAEYALKILTEYIELKALFED
ncbi:MAG: hypothetical protein QM504_11190 [Pseudomonadota bacterium]